MNKEKNLIIDDLPPMHDDTYFFGYGIDVKKPYDMANQIIKLRQENKELSHIVANKVISDYDIDTPLKKELGDARLKIVSLEDAIHCYKQEKEDLIKWLETYAEFNTDEQSIEKTLNEVLDKVRGINND